MRTPYWDISSTSALTLVFNRCTSSGTPIQGSPTEPESPPQTARPSESAVEHVTSPPLQLLIAPEQVAQRLGAALLYSSPQEDEEIPKTFVDFTRWLQRLNARNAERAPL